MRRQSDSGIPLQVASSRAARQRRPFVGAPAEERIAGERQVRILVLDLAQVLVQSEEKPAVFLHFR